MVQFSVFLKALKNGLNGLTNIISKSIIYDGFLKQASISWELENRSPLNKALAKKRKKLPGIFYFAAPQMSTLLHYCVLEALQENFKKHSNQVEDFQKLMDDWKHHQVDNCSFQTHHFRLLRSLRSFTSKYTVFENNEPFFQHCASLSILLRVKYSSSVGFQQRSHLIGWGD